MSDARAGLRIRPGMDVYSADQSRYIGSVVKVWHGGSEDASDQRGSMARETGSEHSAVEGNPHLDPEQGAPTHPTGYIGKRMSGEEMGPVPTIAAGNTGPRTQSADNEYATSPRDAGEVVLFAVRPGRINMGLLTPSIYVPVSAVHSLSMERIVLGIQKDRIPREWWIAPAG